MKLNRRDFLQVSGSAAAIAALPLQAKTLHDADAKNLVLASGLDTDKAFAEGIRAKLQAVTLSDSTNYSLLMTLLSATAGKGLFALLTPADAILLEQVLRDSNKRSFVSRTLVAPNTNTNKWAQDLGSNLAAGQAVASVQIDSQLNTGVSLVAVTANL